MFYTLVSTLVLIKICICIIFCVLFKQSAVTLTELDQILGPIYEKIQNSVLPNIVLILFVQSLCQVLEASVNMGSRVLETQIDGLLLALHQQVSVSLACSLCAPLFIFISHDDKCILQTSSKSLAQLLVIVFSFWWNRF